MKKNVRMQWILYCPVLKCKLVSTYSLQYWAIQGELQLEPESIYQIKTDQDRREFIFMFSRLGPHWCGCTFHCILCMTWKFLQTNPCGHHHSYLNSSGVIIYRPYSEGWKKHSRWPNYSFTVSITKLPRPLQKHSKAY
jgi:hypothetical protein